MTFSGPPLETVAATVPTVGLRQLPAEAARVSQACPVFGSGAIPLGIAVRPFSRNETPPPVRLHAARELPASPGRNLRPATVRRTISPGRRRATPRRRRATSRRIAPPSRNGTAQDTQVRAIAKNLTAMSNGMDTVSNFGTREPITLGKTIPRRMRDQLRWGIWRVSAARMPE